MSPAPNEVVGSDLFKLDMIVAARGCWGGARHEGVAKWGVGEEPFARLVSGPSRAEGDRGRLIPEDDEAWLLSICTTSSSTSGGPLTRRQELPGLSRTTNVAPEVPAHRRNVGLRLTQEPQTSDSYSSPEMSGGGSPEEDASDAASSPVSVWIGSFWLGWCSGGAGLGSLEVGRSRRLQHDSWNQSWANSHWHVGGW